MNIRIGFGSRDSVDSIDSVATCRHCIIILWRAITINTMQHEIISVLHSFDIELACRNPVSDFEQLFIHYPLPTDWLAVSAMELVVDSVSDNIISPRQLFLFVRESDDTKCVCARRWWWKSRQQFEVSTGNWAIDTRSHTHNAHCKSRTKYYGWHVSAYYAMHERRIVSSVLLCIQTIRWTNLCGAPIFHPNVGVDCNRTAVCVCVCVRKSHL